MTDQMSVREQIEEACPKCLGRGRVAHGALTKLPVCRRCGGSGLVVKPEPAAWMATLIKARREVGKEPDAARAYEILNAAVNDVFVMVGSRDTYPAMWEGMDIEQREEFIRAILADLDTLALVLDVIDPNQVVLGLGASGEDV